MNVTTPKRTLEMIFSERHPVESDDESSWPTSCLSSSSSDGYISPSSTEWNLESPFPIGPVQRQTGSSKSRLCTFGLCASSVQKLPLNKIQDPRGQHKGKMGPFTNMELVEESPMKGPIKVSLLTPSKFLAGKDRQNETPKQKSQKLVFEESPDIVSATAQLKALQKPNPDCEANAELTRIHACTGVNKLRSIPAYLPYHSPRARTELFPEPSATSRNTVSSVVGDKKHKWLPSVESYSQIFSRSTSETQSPKRRKMDAVNVGVYHRIKKHTKKRTYKRPVDTAQRKIMPQDRIQSCVEKFAQSITDTNNAVHNEKDIHFTPRRSVQPCLTGTRMESSISPLTPNTVELAHRASHPPWKIFKFQPIWKNETSATVTVNKNIE
jgi:hypothetical protein